jgi:hypothetical protein
VVALSTTEAEYVGLSNVTKELQWLKGIVAHMTPAVKGTDAALSVELHGDNQGALALAKDNEFHSRTKHILPRFQYVHECLRLGFMRLGYVATGQMLADLLTKALGSRKFIHFKAMLGIGGAARGDMEPGQVMCGERLDVPSEY